LFAFLELLGTAFIISHNNLTVRHKSVESAGEWGAVKRACLETFVVQQWGNSLKKRRWSYAWIAHKKCKGNYAESAPKVAGKS